MGRKRKKPDYDPERIIKDLTTTISEAYQHNISLRTLADEFSLNPIKVRKLLITAGVYESETANEVQELYGDGKTVKEIAGALSLSVSSVNAYLPYTKIPYNAAELSVTAERIRRYRERKKAVEQLQEELTPDLLWQTIILFSSYPFRTSKGLKFTYTVKGNEILVDRKKKTITRSSVMLAFEEVKRRRVDGPKQLGCFGASYLYPMFMRFGIIEVAAATF